MKQEHPAVGSYLFPYYSGPRKVAPLYIPLLPLLLVILQKLLSSVIIHRVQRLRYSGYYSDRYSGC